MKVIVIGSGLFGCCCGIELARAGYSVDLVDSENDIMMQASRVNHNRIHLGYHYLRSVETAEQSIEGLLSFLFNYGSAVENQFSNYYAIANDGSKTTPDEFLNFCTKVGIGYDYEYPDDDLLDKNMLSACFKVPEPVFDYGILKQELGKNIIRSNAHLRLKSHVTDVKKHPVNGYNVTINGQVEKFDVVVNASYAGFNEVNQMLGIPLKPLLYEQVVIPEFEYRHEPFGLTVMDGPFCSVMPKGKRPNEFLLYHVKYSVLENELTEKIPDFSKKPLSSVDRIYDESALFMPFIKKVKKQTFNEVVRVVHKNSDDARLTELHLYDNFDKYFAVLSGKITTCIQVALEIKHILQGKKADKRFRI